MNVDRRMVSEGKRSYSVRQLGKPHQLRIEHLKNIVTPTLIVQGERDAFGTRDEVVGYALSKNVEFHWLPDGDHSFKPRRTSGRSQDDNWQDGVRVVAEFIDGL